jgi:hypothetical protein
VPRQQVSEASWIAGVHEEILLPYMDNPPSSIQLVGGGGEHGLSKIANK